MSKASQANGIPRAQSAHSEFGKYNVKEIDDAGIAIPFPQRVIHYSDKSDSRGTR